MALSAISPVAPANSPVPPVIASTESPLSRNGPLDRDLALVQGKRPEALPCLAGQSAEADALVGADFGLVVGVEHLIGEGEDIAGAVAGRAGVGDRVEVTRSRCIR